MNLERIALTIWKWAWRVIRVFLLFIAVFVLHPLVVGGILYTALMFAIFDDVNLDNVPKWDDMDGNWFIPKLEEALSSIFNPLFQNHAFAAWIGVIFVLLLWIVVWGYFGYEMHKFLKKNILRLRGWSNGVIVRATREVTKTKTSFEAYTLIQGEFELLLRGRKLYEITKDKNGNKVENEVSYTLSKGRLDEDIVTLNSYRSNVGHGKLIFKLPEEQYDKLQQSYWRDIAEWKIKKQEWRTHRTTRKPLKPLHPALLTEMKVFGKIKSRIYLEHDYENLSDDPKVIHDAILLAESTVENLEAKLERAKDTLRELKDKSLIEHAAIVKIEAEEKLVIWKGNLKIAKEKMKEIRRRRK